MLAKRQLQPARADPCRRRHVFQRDCLIQMRLDNPLSQPQMTGARGSAQAGKLSQAQAERAEVSRRAERPVESGKPGPAAEAERATEAPESNREAKPVAGDPAGMMAWLAGMLPQAKPAALTGAEALAQAAQDPSADAELDLAELASTEADPAALVRDAVTLAVQVNGKLRGTIDVSVNASKETIEALALAEPNVQKFLEGLTVRKVIVVPGKIVNIVAG